MSRVAGRLVAASLSAASLAFIASTPAFAADLAGPAAFQSHDAFESDCHGPQIVTTHYKEQVCQRGVAGYAACRWVDRRHDVNVAEACDPTVTVEDARPADRGAFPPRG